jgi:hypothetical protein
MLGPNRSPVRQAAAYGDKPFTRCHLYRVMQNRVYGNSQGMQVIGHAAIIDEKLGQRVRPVIATNRGWPQLSRRTSASSFMRMVFDDAGKPHEFGARQ